MTMLELQKVLGDELKKLVDGEADRENAKAVAMLAKQMINNADVVLRTDKYTQRKGERINQIVGELSEPSQMD